MSSAIFNIHPRGKYNHSSPKFNMPLFIGDYSLDGDRMFYHDRRNLQYITIDWHDKKHVHFDLNRAMAKAKRKDPTQNKKEKLDNLLKWILLNAPKIRSKNKETGDTRFFPDFVCFRGLLTTLLCVPYENREGWVICATKFCGTIYLFSYDTPEKIKERENASEFQKKSMSWGFKFEQYMNDGGDPNEGVIENEEYCCVLRSQFNNHVLLYAPEVDAVDPKLYKSNHSDLSSFVELKTSKKPENDKDHRNLKRFKFMKWWSQSYVAGIPRIVCGFRNNDGFVESLQTFQVESLPEAASDHWRKNIMLNFMDQFLNYIKDQVLIDDPHHIYHFCRPENGGHVVCTDMGKNSEWTFLPRWYTQDCFKINQFS